MYSENNTPSTLKIAVEPKRCLQYLLAIILTLHGLSAIAIWADFADIPYLEEIGEFFDVGLEKNIPTLYSVLAWSLAAFATGLVAHSEAIRGGAFVGRWRALALIFLFLAFDEGTTIHEHIGSYLKDWELLPATGLLHFFWVVPYSFLVILLASLYAPFLDALPTRTKLGFILSGTVFIGGAMGVEMFSASVYETKGEGHSVLYHVLYSIEEFMEMLGVALLIFFVLDYLKTHTRGLSVSWQR